MIVDVVVIIVAWKLIIWLQTNGVSTNGVTARVLCVLLARVTV